MGDRIRVSEALHAVPDDTVEAVIDALTAAGASGPQWDSETIEHVLEPLQSLIVRLGFPPVGDVGPDDAYLNFWTGVQNEGYQPVEVAGVVVAETRKVDL
jgi:hypothetical protein